LAVSSDPQVSELMRRWAEGQEQGEDVPPEDLCRGSPELLEEVRRRIAACQVDALLRGIPALAAPPPDAAPTSSEPCCPVSCPDGGAIQEAPPPPERVGRYRLLEPVGTGGFGTVYRGFDEELQRYVAVKVPRPRRAWTPRAAEAFLNEARVLADLDHPGIVPVYDFGRTPDGLCYVVSKLIEGSDLRERIRTGRPPFAESAELIARAAEALHHAHRRGLVHRDIKPANILLGPDGVPIVADFGLALREGVTGQEGVLAGTPGYMSPEQARGEGHLVDARADVHALGAVLYELLTWRRPFPVEPGGDVLLDVMTRDPRPPRQVDDGIPKELERVVMKALAKRASDRHSTALDLSEDLRAWLAAQSDRPTTLVAPAAPGPAGGAPPAPASDSTPQVRVIPKGLRSFDASDTDFFLDLLPGPRDRNGLPDAIRFWKARLDEPDPDQTFRVGLLYGPSGSGKSSLAKAGLLPRLAAHVTPVYVEASSGETEGRLLSALRKAFPALPGGGLLGAVASLRRGGAVAPGRKVLLVLDQFEQWLHAGRVEAGAELVAALRQCDGGRVQALVLVRDDFWMAATRFLRELEIPLREGENAAAVDLFDPRHAKKVLALFGRAFSALPERPADRTAEQESFLDQAVSGLAQDGRVIPVRLAVFAEMVKGKAWRPATLRAVGGMAGVGVTFLEEAFSAPTAPPEHRAHQGAARAVLRALLPGQGTDLKGNRRHRRELLEASGYAGREGDFDELLRILNRKLRLVSPADPEGTDPGPDGPYYQLTHDFLVPSLRDWLTRKQKETWRGRAELRLAERADLWNARPETRHLPAWWEWLGVRLLTRPAGWTEPQRRMMRRAGRHLAARAALLAAALLLLVGAGREVFGRMRARDLQNRLLEATTEDVPALVREMGPYRGWLDGPLRQAYATGDPRKRLHASLALLPSDDGQVNYLVGRLLAGSPAEVVAIRDSLEPHADAVCPPLWEVLEDRQAGPGRRLRAACGLAVYSPGDGRWDAVSGDVAARLVTENGFVLKEWARALRPVARSLLPALARLVADGRGSGDWRTLTALYAEFAEEVPDGFGPLERVVSEPPKRGESQGAVARRQASAAAALAAAGRWDRVWPLLRHAPDPTVRSYLIERLAAGGAEARAVIDRLEPGREPDVSARRALLLALGDFGEDRLPAAEQEALEPRLLGLYRDDPDAGIRGAAGWLLRRWGRKDRAAAIDRELAAGKVRGHRGWYVNSQGQTMVLVPPGEFEVIDGGRRKTVRVGRGFALSAREVTVAEFLLFRKHHRVEARATFTADCPVNEVSWYDAAAYCNWLSEQEEIPEDQWCYVRNEKGLYGPGMKVKANALTLSGYRLPTVAEWEHACRAGSVTRWSMGEARELLGRYAWSMANSGMRLHPAGDLRPNDLGLFDMHGNAWEWCQDNADARGVEATAPRKEDRVDDRSRRPLRGGAYLNDPEGVRSATRNWNPPSNRTGADGFRVARTLP
jgi:serine/threonine protein kinase/formylglycine-generating enzyme required for sulfatase activity